MVKSCAKYSIRTDRHACSVNATVNAENTNFSTWSTSKKQVASTSGEIVYPVKTSIWKLAKTLFHLVLHAGNIKFELINLDLHLVSQNQCIAGVLWIYICHYVSPRHKSKGNFCDSSVDCSCVLCAPYYKRIVLTDTCEITIIRTEFKNIDAVHHSFKNSEWLTSFKVPHDNWRFRSSLELSAFLTSCK